MRSKHKAEKNLLEKETGLSNWDNFTIFYLMFFVIFIITGLGRFLSRDGFLMWTIIIFGYYSFFHVSGLLTDRIYQDRIKKH